jgi:hypothetical protein
MLLKNGGSLAHSAEVAVQRGVAGRAGAMRDIASSMLPHAFPRHGRRRPAPRFYAAGAGGVATLETCVSFSAAAKVRPTTQSRRRYIAARAIFTLHRYSR